MITPPIGVNLYVVQSIREKGRIADVIAGVIPFIIAMLGMIALLVAFPQLTTVFI
jgi:TRAP-type C4-dicarboxylate transport system permease large subunit